MGSWWGTVRGYGGVRVQLAATRHGPEHEGPFLGRRLTVDAADFVTSDGTPVISLLKSADPRLTFIYGVQKIIQPSIEQPFDRDLLYWTVRQLHAVDPERTRRIFWEVGNEVVGAHFDPKGIARLPENRGIKREDNFQGYDLAWKQEYYAEEYLAPAIEAIRRASQDVYGDPRAIRILLGSMNPYNQPNRKFLEKTMATVFSGRIATSLKGKPLADEIDALNVHYMFSDGRDQFDRVTAKEKTMQQYTEAYLRTGMVKRLWITEEYGGVGKGGTSIVDTGFRFLGWAARNRLDAEQTRLIWYGDRAGDGGGRSAVELLGRFLADRRLSYRSCNWPGLDGHLLLAQGGDGAHRLIAALIPRDGVMPAQLHVDLPKGLSAGRIILVRYRDDASPQFERPSFAEQDRTLTIDLPTPLAGASLLLVTPENDAFRTESD